MKNLEQQHEREIERLSQLNRDLNEAMKTLRDENAAQSALLKQRELDFQRIVDSIPIPVAVTTPTGAVEALNEATLDYFGLTLDQLKGWTSSNVVHPDDLDHTLAEQLAAHARGQSYNVESRHRRADGVYRWFNVLGLPVRDSEGHILRWLHLQVDIDDRKRAEAELKQAHNSFADAQRLSATGSFITDLVADQHNWSEEAFRIFEFAQGSDVSVAKIRDMVHPDDLENFDAVIAGGASGQDVNFVFRVITASGALKHIRGLAHVIDSVDGRPLFVGALQDVTEAKLVEEALRERERDGWSLLDGVPVGASITSPTGETETVNKHMLDYFGRSVEDLKAWASTGAEVHPDDFPGVLAAVQRSIKTGEPHSTEQRLRRSDGVYRWFEVRGSAGRATDGSISRWYVAYIDIDDRKRAEDAVRSNEQKLSLILNTIPTFIHVLGTDGSVLYVNQSVLDYTGLTTADVRKDDYRARLFHPEDLERVREERLAALKRPIPFELEIRTHRKDGSYRWFLNRYSPLLDERGSPERWYAVSFDIDDLKRTEAELKETNDFFEEAQRLGCTGSFLTDMDGDEHIWSEEARRIWGFGRDEKLCVSEIRARIHTDDLEGFDAAAAESILMHRSVTHDFRVLVDGATRHLRLAAHAQKRNGHRCFAGALQDVTEQKLADAALDHARSELTHAARALSLGVLTASIAHEVNQPLSGILTNANTCLRMLAAEPPNVDGARETARRTIRDGRRASDVISRLRTLFSRKETVTENVDLNDAAREVLALSAHEFQRHDISVITKLDPTLSAIKGDRVQIQQVIINLLLNACDAIAQFDQRARRIVVATRRGEEGSIELSVRDSGVGLPEGVETRLFDAFYTTKADGMGIGLSVSRSIIERHGGRLWAKRNDGAGATFIFSVPSMSDNAPAPIHPAEETSPR